MSTTREQWRSKIKDLNEELQEAFEELEKAELDLESAKERYEYISEKLRKAILEEPDEYQTYKERDL